MLFLLIRYYLCSFSSLSAFLLARSYMCYFPLSFTALGFDGGLKKPPTDALRPIIPDNACILCITAAAGTELADAYSPDTVIASSPGKEVHDPWAFYLHAALLRQAFAHCGKFPTAASRRSLGRVSVLVWLIILSDQLLIIALPFPAVVPLPRAGSSIFTCSNPTISLARSVRDNASSLLLMRYIDFAKFSYVNLYLVKSASPIDYAVPNPANILGGIYSGGT
ncbi:hypothetical protein FXO37_15355 [Capsicum annuum]|nr:hypothetical protein FXO37_15355 [Capsicum annuum]